jgi:hypothetical protein
MSNYAFRPALQRLMPRILAVPEEAIRPITVDIATAAPLILGVAGKLAAYRPALAALPDFQIALVDSIEELAMATLQAHTDWNAAVTVAGPEAQLLQKVVTLRDQLAADAQSMVLRGMLDKSAIDELKGGNGYRQNAIDLLTLASALRTAWPRIQGRTAVTTDDLDQAETLGAQLLRAVGDRETAESSSAELGLIRARAYTLLLQAYEELRRGLAFVRHYKGDAETIAPSVFGGKKAKSKDEAPVLASHDPEPVQEAPISKDGPFQR